MFVAVYDPADTWQRRTHTRAIVRACGCELWTPPTDAQIGGLSGGRPDLIIAHKRDLEDDKEDAAIYDKLMAEDIPAIVHTYHPTPSVEGILGKRFECNSAVMLRNLHGFLKHYEQTGEFSAERLFAPSPPAAFWAIAVACRARLIACATLNHFPQTAGDGVRAELLSSAQDVHVPAEATEASADGAYWQPIAAVLSGDEVESWLRLNARPSIAALLAAIELSGTPSLECVYAAYLELCPVSTFDQSPRGDAE